MRHDARMTHLRSETRAKYRDEIQHEPNPQAQVHIVRIAAKHTREEECLMDMYHSALETDYKPMGITHLGVLKRNSNRADS